MSEGMFLSVVCAEDIEGVQGCHDVYPTGCSP